MKKYNLTTVPSTTGYLMPLRAINTAGKWRIVVNGVKAHYETLTQVLSFDNQIFDTCFGILRLPEWRSVQHPAPPVLLYQPAMTPTVYRCHEDWRAIFILLTILVQAILMLTIPFSPQNTKQQLLMLFSLLQKSLYHRFLVYDPYDKYFPFAIETFKLPASCACYNGAFVESH